MSAHRYWRVNISATNGGNVEIADLELRTTAGGADMTGSGTASASNNFFGNEPTKAFDSYTLGETLWSTPGTGWLKYDFGSGNDKDITEVAIAINMATTSAPKNFTVEWSDDNASWTASMTLTNITGWSEGQQRTFQASGEVSTPTPGSSARMWRLAVTANNGATLSFAELEFRNAAGADQTAPGTVGSNIFGSTCNVGAEKDKLFDNNTSSVCTLPNNTPAWYAFDLGSGSSAAVDTVAITAGTSTSGTPKDFKLQKSNDGIGWTTAFSFAGATGWVAGQTRYFDSTGETSGAPTASAHQPVVFICT